MGNTFSFLTGESDALEGVSHRGRTSPLHCPAARRREDGWPLSGIRYFPQDRQPRRADRPQPAAVSAREPASDADREADCAAEERVSTLGRPEDPGETQAAVSRPAVPGISTVHAVLDRQGLVTRRRRRRYKAEGTALSRPATPNELWCADYKGEFMLADRRYCYPLTITDFASRYLITCDALATTKETYTFPVFERAFKDFGLPRAIRTDNGIPFSCPNALYGLSRLSVWWLHQTRAPGAERSSERMHLTLKTEATKPASPNFLHQQARFDAFVERFNQDRLHQALGMQVPAEVYRPSPRPCQGLGELDYPSHDWTATVTRCGRICYHRMKINLSQVFAGQRVGVTQVSDRIWLVSFMHYDLGYFDHETCRLEPIENPFRPKVLPMSPE